MSLGNGLGRLAGRVFRVGHPGDFNDPMLAGAPAGVEMGFEPAGVPRSRDGVGASLAYPGLRGGLRAVKRKHRRAGRPDPRPPRLGNAGERA